MRVGSAHQEIWEMSAPTTNNPYKKMGLVSFSKICIILRINGLVTRCSFCRAQSRTLIEGAGFVKAKGVCYRQPFMRQPSLKLVAFNKGFLLCAATLSQGSIGF